MAISVDHLAIQGLLLLKPDRFGDERGYFSETFNARDLRRAGLDRVFVQDNQSMSSEAGTVRGLHFQRPPAAQAKLIRVLSGCILDIAVDLRSGSTTYGQHVAVELSADNWQQLYVPEGFAHGFCTLVPNTVVAYKVTDYYAPDCDDGILWSDPAIGVDWPSFAGTVVSPKDAKLQKLSDLRTPFRLSPGRG